MFEGSQGQGRVHGSRRWLAAAGFLLAAFPACRAGNRAAPAAPSTDIPALVRQLGAARLEARWEAREALLALDEAACPHLEKALADPDLHVAESARELFAELRSFAAQLARWGRAGRAGALAGERYFVGYEDGQPRRFVRLALWEARVGPEAGLLFDFAEYARGEDAVRFQGFLRGDLALRFCEASCGEPGRAGAKEGKARWRFEAAPARVFHPQFLVWVVPFWQFAIGRETLAVEILDLGGPFAEEFLVLLEKRPAEEVSHPAGARRGESVWLSSEHKGLDFGMGVWWDEEKQLIRVEIDRVLYYPVSRDEALKVAGGISWWE